MYTRVTHAEVKWSKIAPMTLWSQFNVLTITKSHHNSFYPLSKIQADYSTICEQQAHVKSLQFRVTNNEQSKYLLFVCVLQPQSQLHQLTLLIWRQVSKTALYIIGIQLRRWIWCKQKHDVSHHSLSSVYTISTSVLFACISLTQSFCISAYCITVVPCLWIGLVFCYYTLLGQT